MAKVLIFAGTTEGRQLVEALAADSGSGNHYLVCVATDYGKTLLPRGKEQITVHSGRIDEAEMSDWILQEGIETVVDATHPYAAAASENIQTACAETGARYLRLLRESVSTGQAGDTVVADSREAVRFLETTAGPVLLTTGSKELEIFRELSGFRQRLYPRILPMAEVVKKAVDLGFDPGHLICMQGPFSFELNLALLKQTKAKYLITKESGKAGGFEEKVMAAEAAGAQLVIIGRPREETGMSLPSILKALGVAREKDAGKPEVAKGQWFPMFTNIKGKRIVVVGAGKIARRRIKTLLEFDCSLQVIAREVSPEVRRLQEISGFLICERACEESDFAGADIVLAATGDRQVNREIGRLCREKNICVNVADRKEECDFYFPGVMRHGDLTIGLTAEGKNHSLVKQARKQIEASIKG